MEDDLITPYDEAITKILEEVNNPLLVQQTFTLLYSDKSDDFMRALWEGASASVKLALDQYAMHRRLVAITARSVTLESIRVREHTTLAELDIIDNNFRLAYAQSALVEEERQVSLKRYLLDTLSSLDNLMEHELINEWEYLTRTNSLKLRWATKSLCVDGVGLPVLTTLGD
tara:strand:- start:1419 stop:1934 length:516 start_codon:yes stop_codon:yes gene_type:complete